MKSAAPRPPSTPLLPKRATPAASPPGQRRLTRWALTLFGFALSLALVANAFVEPSLADGRLSLTPRFALDAWIGDLPRHLAWVLPFAACAAAILPLRALGWGLALGHTRAPPLAARYHAVATGAFVHNALPFGLGDLCRAQLLNRRHALPLFEGLGAALVCKLFEFVALIALASLAIFATRLGPGAPSQMGLHSALPLAATLALFLVALCALAARFLWPFARLLESRGRLPRLARALRSLGQGLTPIRSPRQCLQLALAALGPVLMPALGYGLALQGVGVERGLLFGPLLLGAITLSQFSVGLPIGVGMYYLSATWAARALGVPADDAAALACLTHLTTVATHLALGAVSIALFRVRPGDFWPGRIERARAPSKATFDREETTS